MHEHYTDDSRWSNARMNQLNLTAVVELDADRSRAIYFIGPRNGGLEIE